MKPKYEDFEPRTLHTLYVAVERAWSAISAADPASLPKRNEILNVLAEGAFKAAREGERDMIRLSRAACAFWVSGYGERRPARRSITVH
jgi:hypothetical protein